MKVYELINAYYALQGVKINTLKMDDVYVMLDFRKDARPYVEAFEAFSKDVDEVMKPADFDELVEIERKGDKATPSEIVHHNIEIQKYNKAVKDALRKERNKDVEVAHGTFSPEAYDQLRKVKDWTIEEWESISFLF